MAISGKSTIPSFSTNVSLLEVEAERDMLKANIQKMETQFTLMSQSLAFNNNQLVDDLSREQQATGRLQVKTKILEERVKDYRTALEELQKKRGLFKKLFSKKGK